jgi:hypothetical protein
VVALKSSDRARSHLAKIREITLVDVQGKFSTLKKNRRGMGEVSSVTGVKLFERAPSLLAEMENIALVDTQSIRAKLHRKLKGLFELIDSRGMKVFKALHDEKEFFSIRVFRCREG